MQIPLEKGYPVENSSADLGVLKELEHKGIVRLQEEEYIKCKKCGDPIDIQEFQRNTTVNCPKCDQPCGLSSSRKKRTVIVEVNRKKIKNILDNQFHEAFGKTNVIFDQIDNYWTIQHDGKKYLFYIYEISTIASFLSISEDEGVILYLDERKIRSQIHDLNKSRYQYILDPKFSRPDDFRAFVDSLGFSETLNYLNFRDKFEKFISSIKDTPYEKGFIPQFIEGIKRKNHKLATLYSRLTLVENTILNSKYLKKGGPGLEDFYLVNLLNYLEDGLRCDQHGESKRYVNTKFDFSHLMVAIGHAKSSEDNTLFIVSTNDIAPTVWKKIMDEKRQGHFKYVILDKDLMLMLLYNLDLVNLIEKEY